MAISIIIQNQIHEKIDTIPGKPAHTLTKMVWEAPVNTMLGVIDPHGDTMYNTTQLGAFLDELAGLTPKNEDEQELFTALRDAAETAIRRHGYLWFSGD